MAQARWTSSAKKDLKDIVSFISTRDGRRQTAKKIAQEIYDKVAQFASQPLLGELYSELGTGFRGFVHKRWLIIYQPRNYGIEVYAVLDSSRDFAEFFRRRTGIGG